MRFFLSFFLSACIALTLFGSLLRSFSSEVGRRYGPKYNTYVDLTVAIKSILGAWSFSILISSTCTPLVHLLLWDQFSNDEGTIDSISGDEGPTISSLHAKVLLGITAFVILPMCLLERIGSLLIFSTIGQIGTIVTILTMIIRFFDGSYQEGGKFYDDLPTELRPKFGTDKGAMAFFSPQSLVLISILSTGYVGE